MFRNLLALSLVAVATSGCAPGCSTASSFTGRTYAVFANPVSYELENGALTDDPDFYSYEMPNNGTSNWHFKWGANDVGPVDITIDGITYEGTGDWDSVECGHVILHFDGTYESPDTGARHVFNADANLTIWQDKLGGLLIWNESFTLPNDETGSWRGSSHLDGTLTSGA